ncbi:MAG TPA: pyridoxal-phosphate dependent enzyme [Bryobacteraceae bacterium]|nr:pyridoxal-phosphate dependent enzyme [Bryobacteraceae bacterium]
MPVTEVTFEDIQRAAERIKGIAQRTPVMTSHTFDAKSGVQAVFKCENFQKGGAFKIRGAANFLYSIPKADLPKGVVAYSSGNHAQAVAIAAKSVGAPATLVMPEDAPRSKMEATRAQGPRIITYDRFKDDRGAIGAKISAETGATLVPPYDHPWTIAGQGTTALELRDQAPDLEALVVCIGGGGLIAGCAIAAKHLKPSIRIFGVEPADANDTYLSLRAGKRVEIPAPATIADGLRSQLPGELTFPVIQKHVEQILLVTDDEIRATVKFLLTRMKILVEPSGAVSAAAAMFGKLPPGLGRVGIVLSGGNVDFEQLAGF